jgi:5'-phosphate synthase pdxT subunit
VSVAILALQGDYEAHGKALTSAGAAWHEARTAGDVLRATALVVPGGESTTFRKLMEGSGLSEAIREVAHRGDPVFGTCAGAILLSRTILHPPGEGLGLLDATVVRNAYGRQVDSTIVRLTDLDGRALGAEPLEAVFIRAPRFETVGPSVAVLARRDGDPVLVRQGKILAATFHPELADDRRVLDLFLSLRGAAIEALKRTHRG